MTSFTLTPNDNHFTGGINGDVFSGFGGGRDVLRGNGGNDTFRFQYHQEGIVDGGIGTDGIVMTGHNNHTLSANLKIVSVENIFLSESNFYASANQISEFSKIKPLYSGGDFYVNIEGHGGKVNLEKSYTSSPKLHIEAYDSEAGVNMTGSRKGDVLDGSSFNDKLNGSLGHDTLTGGDGNDTFVFSTKLSASNSDHITDFYGLDDTIALDHHIFQNITNADLKFAFHDVTGGLSHEQRDDRILYDHNTGWLSYDADGRGGTHDPIHFATLDASGGAHPTVDWHDFHIL